MHLRLGVVGRAITAITFPPESLVIMMVCMERNTWRITIIPFAQYVWLFRAAGLLSSDGCAQINPSFERAMVYPPSNGRYGIQASSIIEWHQVEAKGWAIVYIAFSD